MSFDSGGTYIQVTGATTAQPGLTVFSSTWNNIHTDFGGALSQYMQNYISQPSSRNLLWMNGGFEVWQRTTGNSPSFTLLANNITYTADRWYAASGLNQDLTVSGVTPLNNQSQFAARVRRTAGQTGTTSIVFAYPLSGDELNLMKGKLVTLSFLVKAGANFSPASGTLTAFLFTGTGGAAAKRNVTPYPGEAIPINFVMNLTPGGATVAMSVTSSSTIATNISQAEISFIFLPTGTAGAADDFTIDDVQLEVQNSPNIWVPTAYDRISFPQMLRGCKRFYQKTNDYGVFPFSGAGRQNALTLESSSVSKAGLYWRFPVEMRTSPVIGAFNPAGSGINWINITTGSSVPVTVETSTANSKGVFLIAATVTAADCELMIHAAADGGI